MASLHVLVSQTNRDISEDKAGPPGAKSYVFEATKKTIEVLQSVAGITGVPLLNDVLDIGLRVIDLCEVRIDLSRAPSSESMYRA